MPRTILAHRDERLCAMLRLEAVKCGSNYRREGKLENEIQREIGNFSGNRVALGVFGGVEVIVGGWKSLLLRHLKIFFTEYNRILINRIAICS